VNTIDVVYQVCTNVFIAPPSYDEVIASSAELPRVVATSAVGETRFSDSHHIVSRGTLPPSINATSTLPVVSTGNHTE